jgi:hypothetical protein
VFSSPDAAVAFGKFCNNFIVRVLDFSTSHLLGEGWESGCSLDYEMGSVTDTFTEHIVLQSQVVIDDDYVDGM